MLPKTSQRIAHNTSQELREKLDQKLKDNVSKYLHADREQIDQRLAELDREWTLERVIELDAPLTISTGVIMGMFYDRKWFGLSVYAAAMTLIHNTQGWHPLLPLLQRLGIRSQNDIEQERMALKVLRKDHETYTRH